jgi:signal transduction histidine kinase
MLTILSKTKITPKFLIFIVLIGIMPLLVLGGVSVQTASSVIEQDSTRYTAELLGNQATYLQLKLSPVATLIENLSSVQEIRKVIDAGTPQQDTYDKLATQAQIGNILNNFSNIDGLISIDIFTMSGLRFHYGDTLNTENVRDSVKQTLIDQATGANGQTVWSGISENVNANSPTLKVLPAIRLLQRYDSTTLAFVPTALMVVNYDPKTLYDYFHRINFGEGAYMMVIDGKGQIIYHPDATLIGTQADATVRAQLTGTNHQLNVTLNNEDYQLTSQVAGVQDWMVVAFIPQNTLHAKTSLISASTLIALVFSLILVLLAAVAINYVWLTPVRQIIQRFEALQRGEPIPETPLPMKTHDEIGELTSWFNLFVKKLDELKHTTQLANESAQLKSEFLATMSHEIRTPLNAIEGFTGIMLSGMGIELQPRARSMLERVAVNNKRLLNLVNDFLDLSRIESGRWEMLNRPVSPRKMSDQWYKEVSAMVEKKGLQLDIYIDPQLPDTLYTDEDSLSKITLNLLGNALKFTEQGRVELAMRRADDSQWTIEVTDTGIGIPPHAHEFIFDEFRQVDMSSTRKQGGTGLGLAIVKKIVRLMKGTITLKSEVGKGSTFTVTLPLIVDIRPDLVTVLNPR